MEFVDEREILVKGGKGGDGVVRFRREKFVPLGGPAGGDGGDGGDVILEGSKDVFSLASLGKNWKFKAQDGEPGKEKKKSGKRGKDLVLVVPLGTEVYENGRLIHTITRDGERFVLARGGKGGKGNYHFATPTRRAPRIAEKGKEGETKRVLLKLKLIADAGLVGFPNVGKSSLLRALTRSQTPVGDYPFTTTIPHLGAMFHRGERIIIADLPGIIEGASEGRGMGLEFLKHTEKAGVLVLVVAPTEEGETFDPEVLLTQYGILRGELQKHSPSLWNKMGLVVVNKTDLPGSEEAVSFLKKHLDEPVVGVSAATKDNLGELKDAIYEAVKGERE